MNNDLKFVSLADKVFETLENEILSGEITKGTVITESALSERLGVSRTPVREAIRRLEQEDIIKITTKGIMIKGVDPQDIEDIYEIRSKIEGLAARRCAEVASEEGITELSEILDLQEFYTSKGLADKIKNTDSRFHETIYELCGSRMYQEVLGSLHRKISKYRKLAVQDEKRARNAVEEHRQVFLAIKNRDGDSAETLMSKHIEEARNNIIKNII